jgi:hypothetical protein
MSDLHERRPGDLLTVDDARHIFPVARSDRRKNKDLFVGLLSEAQLRDDERFYEVITQLFSTREFSRLRVYDNRLLGSDNTRKSFGFRALRWLANQSAGALKYVDILDLPSDHFPAETLGRAVHQVFLGLDGNRQPASAAMLTDQEVSAVTDGADWSVLARSIEQAASALQGPDIEAATRLVELANTLVEACKLCAAAAAQRDALDVRSGALRERVMSLAPLLSDAWPATMTEDLLDRLHLAVTAGEDATRSVHAAERTLEQIDSDLRAATAERTYARVAELSRQAEQSDANVRSARQVRDHAIAAVRELLAIDADVSSSPPYENPNRSGAHEPDSSSEPISETIADIEVDESPEAGEHGLTVIAPAAQAIEGSATVLQQPAVSPDDSMIPVETIVLPAADSHASSDAEPAPSVATESHLSASPPRQDDRPGFRHEYSDLLARYIEQGEFAFAYHLARLAPESVPLPASILRACVLLPAIDHAEEMAEPQRNQTLAEMVSALPDSRDSAAAGRLALAAMLRPALLDPDHGARDHVASLRGYPGLEAHTALIDALSSLGFDVRLSTTQLRDMVDQRVRPIVPDVCKEMSAWLHEARHRKTVHQPTYVLFHHELRVDGRVGRVIEAASGGKVGAEVDAQALIDMLDGDRGSQEAFVREAERQGGRPRRNPIEGMALDWFCRGLQEACDLLSRWMNARRVDSRRATDVGRERLQRVVGPVRKALESATQAPVEADGLLAHAAGIALLAKLEELQQLLAGRVPAGPSVRARDLLELPLDRLPGGCQDWTSTDSESAFDQERADRDRRLLAALSRPECIAVDLSAAFNARVSDKAVLPAQRLLQQLRQCDGESAAVRVGQQRLWELIDAERRSARERVMRLRQSLSAIGYLDPDVATSLPADLASLEVLDDALTASPEAGDVSIPALSGIRKADVPPDFPQLDAWLSEMEARRDRLRTRISERQRAELELLRSGLQGASAKALLEEFGSLDPVTVDDAIAELKAGRAVPLPPPDRADVFTRFYPRFVDMLATNAEEMARARVLKAANARAAIGALDMSDVDERRAKTLTQLLEVWGQGDQALRLGKPAPLRDAMARLFGLIGFSGVRIVEGREAIPGRMRLFMLNCDVPRSAGQFIPPAFGSAAAGRYQLLAARSDVAIDQFLRQIGSEAPDAAWIVLFFGRLSVADRSKLARQARTEGRAVLVLDESLLMFAALEEGDPFSTVFECTLPFSWVQPYTINAGQIPPESFFGREAEIERIVSKDGGGCLIYGGRQLGKSVLLNHIRCERHRPDRGELAIFVDIKPLGGAGQPAERIWKDLAHGLLSQPGFENVPGEPRAVVDAIEAWLARDTSRRLLVMFDEADNFLRTEHASGYPHLLRMKGLMERTGRRFKAVFAGLHNVRRMARAPNSPLPHLGEPICIGPMNQSPENRAALRRLAVEPMLAAGLDYADPRLVSDMLARMNYYPSLVQVFGRQIVESLGRKPRAGSEGPRWRLDRGDLFDGAAAERIAQQIRDRFQLTLNLDVRYDCIARSIALHRLESVGKGSDILAHGLTASEVRSITHWPRFLAHPTLADFEELLEELVDLGVLTRYPDSRYGLRNAQVAQLLGQRDDLAAR